MVGEGGHVGAGVDDSSVPDGMQDRVVRLASERDVECIASGTEVGCMERLSQITGEMSDELQGVGTGQVVPVLDLVVFGEADAVSEDHALVCDGGCDATSLGAVTVVVRVADRGGSLCGREVSNCSLSHDSGVLSKQSTSRR